ncbi:MAG: peptidoglycan-binding protein [Bifidobacteriaceae bacterium]|nr:peptidoglycan-binding protein [Bifidobacteriaceae bacterium]
MTVSGKSIHVPVYITSKTTRNCIVGHPTNGTHVKAVQNAAKSCYGQNLGNFGVDGYTGEYFISAVKGVQSAVGVTKDGIYGPNTHNGYSGNPSSSGMKFYPSCLRDNILA